jgi:hypothetical protein
MGKAKLMGLLIDRKESGKPGEFASMSIEELRKQLKADLDGLEAIRKAKTCQAPNLRRGLPRFQGRAVSLPACLAALPQFNRR